MGPGWLWLMLFVPSGIALSAVGLEFLERLVVSADGQSETPERTV